MARHDRAVRRPPDDRDDRRRGRRRSVRAAAEGGYRGLENQTYRVEVHDGGAPGTATFKWSRDNGSVAIPVVEMVSTTVLRLSTVGKDDVLRVSTNDWVEILDDHYELNQKPGVHAQGDGRRRGADDHVHGRAPDRPAACERRRRGEAPPPRAPLGSVGRGQGRRRQPAHRPRCVRVERTDHRAVELGDAGRARARRRRLVLDRVGRKRQVPPRRPLDLRRAHRRRLGRGARRTRRRSASTTTTRGSASSRSPARRPTAGGSGRRSATAEAAASARSASGRASIRRSRKRSTRSRRPAARSASSPASTTSAPASTSPARARSASAATGPRRSSSPAAPRSRSSSRSPSPSRTSR